MNLGDHIIVGKQMFRMAKGGKVIPGRMLITKVVFQDAMKTLSDKMAMSRLNQHYDFRNNALF